jgi:ABC-type uncharacterized transport system permease subunit
VRRRGEKSLRDITRETRLIAPVHSIEISIFGSSILKRILSKVGWQISMINNVSKIKTHGKTLMTFETLFASAKDLYIVSYDDAFDKSIGMTCIGEVIRRCSDPYFINMIYEVLIESLRYLFDDYYFIVGD